MKGYNDFKSINEFLDYYHLDHLSNIFEDKKCDKKGCKKGKEEEEQENLRNPQDEFGVVYADTKPKVFNNIFKHIIIFTNSRDPEDNKTLKNIYDAIDELKKSKSKIIPELHVFVAANIDIDEDTDSVIISDDKGEFKIDTGSNIDTLIFSRLGVQGEDRCEHAVTVLQDRGFLVLNPVRYSALACDKYDSACLFKKADIPQPNFTLMTKDILYDEELFLESMQEVYPKWDAKDQDKNKDLDVVVKILDGHGGTGVALIDGKRLFAWLQLIFAINPEQRLLIQKKEEADGGDIRVHVLTLRNKQVILAAMKRVKINNDFRSNVSLGATAEPITLTKEQEQIALKTAKVSKLPWCAVDIMPLVKGSNKEIGDNVVLEINASPGTAGISDVIKSNFINVLLNELDDPQEFMLQDKTAGYTESVMVDFGNGIEKTYLAKLDTGNSATAPTLEVGEFSDDGKYISFEVDGKKLKYEKIKDIKIIAGEEHYNRPVIKIPLLSLGVRKVMNVEMAVTKHRDSKTTNMLLNRDILSKLGYVVHPMLSHVLTKEIEKVKIL